MPVTAGVPVTAEEGVAVSAGVPVTAAEDERVLVAADEREDVCVAAAVCDSEGEGVPVWLEEGELLEEGVSVTGGVAVLEAEEVCEEEGVPVDVSLEEGVPVCERVAERVAAADLLWLEEGVPVREGVPVPELVPVWLEEAVPELVPVAAAVPELVPVAGGVTVGVAVGGAYAQLSVRLVAGGAALPYMAASTHTLRWVTPATLTAEAVPQALSSLPARQPKAAVE